MHRTEKHAVRLVKGSCDRVFMRAFDVYLHAARTVIEHIEISDGSANERLVSRTAIASRFALAGIAGAVD